MSRKDRIVGMLRAALGENDNAAESGGRTVIINGNVGAVFVGKKNGGGLIEVNHAPSRIPIDRQNVTPSRVIRSILDGLPPPARELRGVADQALGSGQFVVGFREAMRGPLRTS